MFRYPFEQLPVLIEKDNSGSEVVIGQSQAIARYLANKHGMK
jgi:glutathione S-transferase